MAKVPISNFLLTTHNGKTVIEDLFGITEAIKERTKSERNK